MASSTAITCGSKPISTILSALIDNKSQLILKINRKDKPHLKPHSCIGSAPYSYVLYNPPFSPVFQ